MAEAAWRNASTDTKAPTGSALTGSDTSKDTKALTGSEPAHSRSTPPVSASLARGFHDTIVAKLDQGLTAQWIFQNLQTEHDFTAKYHSVRRYIAKLRDTTELPFRRLECEPGAELQVDFSTGAKCQHADGKLVQTHVFRAVLSHSRKGYSEAVTRLTIERFIQVLENTFQRLGGVPKVVVFDNGSCAVKHADWYDAELHPKINDFCKHYGFALIPTRPRTPRHKGETERDVGYVKDNALKARTSDFLDNDCLNDLTSIEEIALDTVWQHEFGSDVTVPKSVISYWTQPPRDTDNIIKPMMDADDWRLPRDRFKQLALLQRLTGSKVNFDAQAKYVSKDTYVLLNAIHQFRNRTEHADGQSIHAGVAVSALLLCIELLSCLERELV